MSVEISSLAGVKSVQEVAFFGSANGDFQWAIDAVDMRYSVPIVQAVKRNFISPRLIDNETLVARTGRAFSTGAEPQSRIIVVEFWPSTVRSLQAVYQPVGTNSAVVDVDGVNIPKTLVFPGNTQGYVAASLADRPGDVTRVSFAGENEVGSGARFLHRTAHVVEFF